MSQQKNVYGEPLQVCSTRPMTGFTRQGSCDTGPEDVGSHTVCVQVTREFLEFSRARGNDLTTPVPAFGFPGLKPGDRWCVCAARWKEAFDAGCAPQVVMQATNAKVTDVVDLMALRRHAIDVS
jgi:uncharacterized protein (DUF2237 family)